MGTGRQGVRWCAGHTRVTLPSSGVLQASPPLPLVPRLRGGDRPGNKSPAPRETATPVVLCGHFRAGRAAGRRCHVARPEAPGPAARVPALDRAGPARARPQNPPRPACQVQGRARKDAARSGPRGILRVDRALSAVPADRGRAQVCGKGRRPSAAPGSVGEGGWVPT